MDPGRPKWTNELNRYRYGWYIVGQQQTNRDTSDAKVFFCFSGFVSISFRSVPNQKDKIVGGSGVERDGKMRSFTVQSQKSNCRTKREKMGT